MPVEQSIVKLKTGEQTELDFQGNSAGGYEWNLSVTNEAILHIEKKFVLDNGENKLPGSSAREVFIVKALKKGTAVLHFKQQRAWDLEAPPRKEKEFVIEIE